MGLLSITRRVGTDAATGVTGATRGARQALGTGPRNMPAAALGVAAVGAAGLVDWPILLAAGGAALVLRQLRPPPAAPLKHSRVRRARHARPRVSDIGDHPERAHRTPHHRRWRSQCDQAPWLPHHGSTQDQHTPQGSRGSQGRQRLGGEQQEGRQARGSQSRRRLGYQGTPGETRQRPHRHSGSGRLPGAGDHRKHRRRHRHPQDRRHRPRMIPCIGRSAHCEAAITEGDRWKVMDGQGLG